MGHHFDSPESRADSRTNITDNYLFAGDRAGTARTSCSGGSSRVRTTSSINGRGLRDDFGAVVYSTVFNFPMRTELAPFADLRADWPYLPEARPLPAADAAAVPTRQNA